jgi:hypothetical protein
VAKPLADATLDVIPRHGVPDLPADGDAQAAIRSSALSTVCRTAGWIGGEHEHDERSRRRATTALQDISELPGAK